MDETVHATGTQGVLIGWAARHQQAADTGGFQGPGGGLALGDIGLVGPAEHRDPRISP